MLVLGKFAFGGIINRYVNIFTEGIMTIQLVDEIKTQEIKEDITHKQQTVKQQNINPIKATPTSEIMAELNEAADNTDHHAYHRLINQIDWDLAEADVLDEALGVTISFADMKQTKRLATLGYKRFPEHKGIVGAWKLVNPKPAQVAKKREDTPPNWFKDSMDWLSSHVHDYQKGHWMAVNADSLVTEAPTYAELNQKLAKLRNNSKIDGPILVHQVIS